MNNNKLIAEFMGNDIVNLAGVDCIEFENGKRYEKVRDLQYHTSWDWLMPVLDKIKEIRCLPDEHDESFSWVCKSSDIEAE